MSILTGNGDGTFRPLKKYSTEAFFPNYDFVTSDLNSDNIVDLAVSCSNLITIFPGNGDGTFRRRTPLDVGLQLTGVVAGDFTSDGELDLAVADSGSNSALVLLQE